MTKDIQKEMKRLAKLLEEHGHNYYVLDQPVIADREYDDLNKKLCDLEDKYPQFKETNSPTERIGSKLPESASTVKHRTKMYSLDNTYSIEDINDWHGRVLKGLDTDDVEYIVELKMDGISGSLSYDNGSFVLGATRGDGSEGENVTPNMKTVQTIPLKLKGSKKYPIPTSLDVRSEIYMDRAAFDKLNNKRKANDEILFANPRNATSGAVKLLDSRVTAQRNLKCFVHSFGLMEGAPALKTQWEFFKRVQAWGFVVNPLNRVCKSIDEVIKYCLEFQEKRDTLPYEVDGVVIKVNNLEQQAELGYTLKSPRWAVSYKFPAQQATTKVENITVQVGRTGVLTPVAELTPVECGGVIISRATLHNFDEIQRLKVNVGDGVLIERAGDVIPKVVKVVIKESKGYFKAPKKCLECGAKVKREDGDAVSYRCINDRCPKKIERALVHFAARGAMDIEGLGESVVTQLISEGLVKNICDIFKLKEEDLLPLDLFAEKKAKNLIKSIDKSKSQSLSRVLFALGIPNIGIKAADTLATKYKNVEALFKVTQEDFVAIDDIGVIMADSLVEYFQNNESQAMICELKDLGLEMIQEEIEGQTDKFGGAKFVFTGEMTLLTRQEAAAKVKQMGGAVVSSVSKKTSYVVAGGKVGSKYDKAVKLGVTILNEQQFQELVYDE
ncbi:MAG: DNA ligase (NAD+) [Lysobacterales bacterium]|jgi:DNA ligase (NAD+)